MSKIYEALLRAEIDRVANQKGEPQPTEEPLDPRPTSRERAAAAALSQQTPGTTEAEAPQQPDADLPPRSRRNQPLAEPPAIAPQVWNLSRKQLPALEERGSAVEQFRSLRSRMREFRDMDTLKSILVSSGLPKEGKSFITVNLALSLARHKSSRVLLIDGDMRRGTQHHLLGAPQQPGLTEYLSGNATLAEVLQRAAPNPDGSPLAPGISSLHFIAAGADADNAADLSGNQRFARLMETVYPMYEWIIVDSSPVNLVADGVNLARNCDGVLLVTREATTRFQTAQRALSELKASKVIGVVLNAVRNPPTSEGYYGYGEYDKLSS